MTDSPRTPKVADEKNLPNSTENNSIQSTSSSSQAEIHSIRILSPSKNKIKPNFLRTESLNKIEALPKNKKHAVGANKAVDKQKIEYPKNADLQMMNSALPKISEIETEKNSKISKNSLTKNNNNLSNNSEMNMKSQNDNEAKNSVQSPILQMELGFEKMKNKMVRSEMIEKVDHETENYQTNVQKTVEENAPESKILNKINTLKTDEISLDERKTKRVSFYKTKDREKNDLSRQNHTLVKSLIKSKTFVKPTNAENVFHTLVKNQTTSIKEEKKMPLRKKEISKTNVQKTSKTLLKESFSSLTSKMVRFQTKSEKIKMTKNFSNRNATKNNLLAENDPRLSSKNSNLVFVNNNNFLDDEEEEKNDELLEEAATEEPTAEEPAFEEPAAEEPFAENSVAGEPAAEELAAKKLVAEQPPTEEPAAEQIASEKPTAEEPTAEEPTAEEPASEAKPFEEIVSSTAPNIKNESTRKVTQKSGEIKTSQVQALSKKASSGQKKSLKSQNESRKISALTTGAEGKVSKAMQRSEILPIASDKVELDAQAEEKKVIVSVKSVEKEVESDEPIHSTIEGVEIIEIDRKRQYIKVENKEQQEISLSSKVLLQRYDDAIYTVYLFPQYTLKAKTVVTVWSNGATNKVEDESNLVHKLQAFWACSGPTTKTILCNDATPYLWSKAKRSKVSKELDACDEVIKKVKQSKEGTGISYGKTRIVKSFDMSEFYEELDKDLLNPCVFHGCLNKKPVKQMDLTCETAVTKTGEVFDCDKLLKERKKNKTLDSNSLACDCDKYKRSSKKKSRRTKNCGCDSDDLEFKNDKKIKNTFKQKFSSKKRGCNNSRSKPDCSCDDSKKNNSSNDSSSDDCYQKKYKKLKSYESSLTNNSSKSVEECLKLLEQTKRLMDDDDGGDCDGFCSRFKNGGKPKSFENGVECSDSDDSCQNVETKKKKSKVIQMKDSEKCFPKKNKQKNNSYQRKERDFCKNSDDEYELNNFLLCGEKEDNSACAKNWKKQNLSDQKTQNNSMKYKKKISEEFDSECENDYKKQYKPENIINSREKQKTSCDDYTKKQTKLDEDFLFVFDAKNMKSELKRNDNDCLCNDWDFSNDSFEIRQPRYEDNDFECKLLSKRNQSEDNFKDYTKKQTKLDKNFFAEFGSQNGNSTFGNNKKVSCDELDLSNDSFRIMEPKVKKKVEKSKNFNKQETKANKKHEKNFFRGNKCKISNKNFSSNRELISSCDSDSDDSLDSISENKIVKSKSEKPVLTIKGILKNKQVTSCVNENKERFNDELDFSFNENKISKDFLTSKIETNTYIPRRIEDKLKYLREMKDINDSFNNNIYNKEKKSFLSNIEAQSQMIKESFIFSDGNNNNNNKTIQNPSVTPQKQNNKVFVTKRSSDSKHEMMDLRKSDKSKKSSKFEKNLPNSLDESPGLLQKNSIILKDEKTVKKMNFSREKNAAEKSTSQERKSMFVKTNSRINEAKTTEKMENAALKTFTKTSFQKNTSKARENAFKKSVFKHGSKIENFSVEKTLFKEKYNYSSINKQNNFNNLKSFPIKKFDEGDPRIRARSSNMIPVNNNRPLDDEDEEEEEEENENPPKTAEEAPAEAAEEAPPEAAEKAPPEAAEEASLEAAEETPAEAVEKAPLEAAEEALFEAAEEALTEAAEEAPLEIAEKAVEEALPKEVASEKTALEEITPELVEKTIPEIEPEAFEAADEVVSQPIERNEASENKIEVDTEAKPVVNDGETNNIQKEPLVGDEGFNDAQVATSKAIFKVGSVQSRKSETEKKFSKVEQKPQSNLNEEDFFVPNGCESKVQEFKIVDVDKKRQFIRIKYISDEILESSSNVLVQRFNNSIYTAFFFMTSILNPGDIVTLWSEDANEKVVNSWNFVHQKQSYWACVGPSTVTILEKWDENVYKHFWTENAKLPEKSKKPNSGSSLKQKYKNGENIVKSFDLSDLCNESDDDLFGCTLYCCSKKPVKQMVLSCENGEKNSHQNGHFNCDLFCESLKHNEACSTKNCDCERHVSGFKQRSKKRKDRGCGCNGGSANNETKQIETTSSESIKSNEFEERVENIKNNYELKKAEKIKPSKKVKDCMKLLNITDKLLDDEFDMTSSGSKRFEAVDKKNKKSKKIFENLDSCFSNDDQEDENSCGSSGSEVVKTLSKNCGKNDLCTEQDIEELENNEDHVRKCCEKNSRSPRKDKNTNKDIRNKKYSYKKHDDSFEKPETEEDGDELVRKCCQNYFKPLKKEKKRENKYSSKDCQKYKKGLKNKDSIENYKIENYLACNSDDGDDKDCNFDHCAFCRCSGDKKNKYNSALKKCYNQARSSIEEDYTLERFLKCSDSDKNDDCEDTCGFCRCNKTKNNIQVSQHKLSETSHASDNDEHQSDTSCGCCKNYRTTSPSEDRSSCFCLEYTTEESD